MTNTKPPKIHAPSYIETNQRVEEMTEGYSLEEVLLSISEGGNYEFIEDKKIRNLNKESKTYLFRYSRTQKLIKITGEKWYSVSDDVGGVGLGSFI